MYKLNPELPLVWRTPTSFQIGVNPAVVLIDRVYPSEERFLSALQRGISDVSLGLVAEECGMSPHEAESFLASMAPALVSNLRQKHMRIALDGCGPFVDSLGLLLIGMGHSVVRAGALTAGKCDLAFVVGDYILEPHRTSDWLRREVPHVPIVFGSNQVDIGPVLGTKRSEPRHSPCYHCIELHRHDRDSAWIAVASQLIGVTSPLQKPLVCAEVASMVARWVHTPESIPLESNQMLTLSAENGQRTTTSYSLHPDCACQALPRNVIVLGSTPDLFPAEPRIGRVASSRA